MNAGEQPGGTEKVDRRRLIASTAMTLVILTPLLFVPAGTWAWDRGWLFLAVLVASGVGLGIYLQRINPEVIAARVNRHQGTKPWDRWVVGLLLILMVSIIPVAALDDGRYRWSDAPWWVCGVGYAVLLAGVARLGWAESVNKFFEPTVRIQTERGDHVIETGPYAIVGHPGYAAAFLLVLGMPLSLGSYWALVPAVASYLVLVVRTVLEDRTLHAELPGYREYAQRVRYRLIPGLW